MAPQNGDVVVVGERCLLVPYRTEHVPTYHGWMEDAELRAQTASERLSLEEEYAMQRDWAADPDKVTFIVLDPARRDAAAQAAAHRDLSLMAGDVNLFVNDNELATAAELELMVADTRSRRKGVGREAACLMMRYGVEHMGLTLFRVKVGFDNAPSLRLFAGLGFQEVSRSEVFQEVTLEISGEAAAALAPPLRLRTYDGD